VKKIIIAGVLALALTTGCLATKLLLPTGEPLTVEETEDLNAIKKTVKDVTETVGWAAEHTNDVLVPGGAGTAILIAVGTYLNRRRKRKNAG
jgi:hypothetical protein